MEQAEVFESSSGNMDFVENITRATIAKNQILRAMGFDEIVIDDNVCWPGFFDEVGSNWLNSEESTRFIATAVLGSGFTENYLYQALEWVGEGEEISRTSVKAVLMDSSNALYEEAKVVQDIILEIARCLAARTAS